MSTATTSPHKHTCRTSCVQSHLPVKTGGAICLKQGDPTGLLASPCFCIKQREPTPSDRQDGCLRAHVCPSSHTHKHMHIAVSPRVLFAVCSVSLIAAAVSILNQIPPSPSTPATVVYPYITQVIPESCPLNPQPSFFILSPPTLVATLACPHSMHFMQVRFCPSMRSPPVMHADASPSSIFKLCL